MKKKNPKATPNIHQIRSNSREAAPLFPGRSEAPKMWREGGYRGISGSCGSPCVPKFGGRGDADGRIQLLGASQAEPLQRCLHPTQRGWKIPAGSQIPVFGGSLSPRSRAPGNRPSPAEGGAALGARLSPRLCCPRPCPRPRLLHTSPAPGSPPGRAPLLQGKSRLGETEGNGVL